jgi:serine/threonine protein kinase
LDTVLGRGKFGEVRLGEWWGTTVAVKFLHNFDLEENADLFRKEIEVMKELHHPHIVQFLGFSKRTTQGDAPVILMEYCLNGSVEDYLLKHDSSVGLNMRVRWASQMAQALAYLHNRKPDYLIHRDLKPQNFMLTSSLQCRIGDFGISRLFQAAGGAGSSNEVEIASQAPRSSPRRSVSQRFSAAMSPRRFSEDNFSELDQTSNVGTARYMAPEVYNRGNGANAKYGVKADVFSVGMVFYFVFEGVAPRVPGGGKPETHFAALAQGTRPVYVKTKPELQRVIDQCLRFRALERPSSAELVKLLKPLQLKHRHKGGGLFGCAGGGSSEAAGELKSAVTEAEKVLVEVDERLGKQASSDDLRR